MIILTYSKSGRRKFLWTERTQRIFVLVNMDEACGKIVTARVREIITVWSILLVKNDARPVK